MGKNMGHHRNSVINQFTIKKETIWPHEKPQKPSAISQKMNASEYHFPEDSTFSYTSLYVSVKVKKLITYCYNKQNKKHTKKQAR